MKKLMTVCLSWIVFQPLMAQVPDPVNPFRLPPYTMPSPVAASIGRYGEVPVSIQSGVPDITIPLYEIKTGKQQLPITISFHGGGIRVMDKMGPVGLGWTLNAGGIITRLVKGVPDEHAHGMLNKVLRPDDPAYSERLRCLALQSQLLTGWIQEDSQADHFIYKLPHKNGKFLPRNKEHISIHPGYMTIPYDPIKIDTNDISDGYFRIRDIDGAEYLFGRTYEGVLCREGSYRADDSWWWSSEFAGSWLLTGMVSPDKTDTIRFVYNNIGHTMSESSSTTLTGRYHDDSNPNSLAFSKNEPTINYDYITNTQHLSTIQFRNGEVKFLYTGVILKEIKVFGKQRGADRLVKHWQLFQNGEKLDSVREVGTDGSVVPPFVFQYYGQTNPEMYKRPPYNSKGQDLWGFYNGKDQNPDLLWVDGINGQSAPYSVVNRRMPDSVFMKYGQIRSITYPTGGSTTFIFEPHKATTTTNRLDTTWMTLSKFVTTWTPIYQNTAYSTDFTITEPMTQVIRPDGTYSNSELVVNISTGCTPGPSNCVANSVWVKVIDITSSTSQPVVGEVYYPVYTAQSSVERKYFNLQEGRTYRLVLVNPGNVSGSTIPQYHITANLYTRKYLSHQSVPVENLILCGGMRIKQIINTNGTGSTQVREYNYLQPYFNSDYFTGDYTLFANNTYGYSKLRRGYTHNIPRPAYKTWHEDLAVPLSGNGSSAISYGVVEELDKDPVTGSIKGKTEYCYNKAIDYVPKWMPYTKIDREHVRNQLRVKNLYRNVGSQLELIQKDSIVYKDLDEGLGGIKEEVRSYISEVNWLGGEFDGDIGNQAETNTCLLCPSVYWNSQFRLDTLVFRSPRIVKSKVFTTTYDPAGGNAIQTVTQYDYDNLYHMLPVSIRNKNSKGDSIVTKYIRPHDVSYYNSCANCDSSFDAALSAARNYYRSQHNLWKDSFNYYIRQRDIANNPLYPDKIMQGKNQFRSYINQTDGIIATAANNYMNCLALRASCQLSIRAGLTANNTAILRMQELNMGVPELEVKSFVNNVLAQTRKTNYIWIAGLHVVQSSIQSSIYNKPLENRMEFTGYENGTVVQMKRSNDMDVSLIWGHDTTWVVAEVTGALSRDVAYTSFESEDYGNWQLSPYTLQSGGVTGDYYFQGNGFALVKPNLTASARYTVTYWSRNGAYSIPGTEAGYPKQLQSISKGGVSWNLFEHRVTGQTTIQISGTGSLDELRLHPVDAMMKTYTYRPWIGISSVCTPSHQIEYYEYDVFNRLKTVLDYKGNILKQTDYKFQQSIQ